VLLVSLRLVVMRNIVLSLLRSLKRLCIAGSISFFAVACANAQSWTSIKTFEGYISRVKFLNPNTGFVALGIPPGKPAGGPKPVALYKTTDGGQTWLQATIPSGYAAEIADIEMVDSLHGWIAMAAWGGTGDRALWRTTDAGMTWTETSLVGTGTEVHVTPSAIIVTDLGNHFHISTDGGNTFSNGGLNSTNSVGFVDALHGVITVFRGANWLSSSDGGLTWNNVNLNVESWSIYPDTGTPNFYAAPEGPTNGQARHGIIYHSSDYGITWGQLASFPFIFTGHLTGIDNSYLFLQVQDTETINGVTYTGIYYSTDQGLTFMPIGGPSAFGDTRFSVLKDCSRVTVYAFDDQSPGTLYQYSLGTSVPSNTPPSVGFSTFALTPSCIDGDAYALFNVGCSQYRIDSVRVEQDTGSAFQVDPKQKFPALIGANKSDTVHVLFHPNHRLGGFGATLHVYGTLPGSGTPYDTTIALVAGSVPSQPEFYSSTTDLLWSSLTECASGDTTITYTNAGCDTVTIDSLHLRQGQTLTSSGLTLPKKIPPNGTVKLSLHFVPNGLASDSLSSLVFYSTPGNFDSLAVPVFAHAAPAVPVLTASHSAVNFGSVPSCDTMDTVLTLKNMGCDSLTIETMSALLGGYTADPPLSLPVVLAKDSSIALHVRYRPQSLQDTETVFFRTDHDGKSGSAKFHLAGSIGTAQLTSLTTGLSLSTIAVCGFVDTTILFSNPGCDTMTITSADLVPTGDVRLANLTLPISIPPHSDTSIEIRFSSNKAETLSAELTLVYSIEGMEQPEIELPIDATASAGQEVLVMDTALRIASLPICSTDSLIATIYNGGCDTLLTSATDLTGDPDFSLVAPFQSLRLPPRDSARIAIRITPHAKGVRSGTLRVHYRGMFATSDRDSTIALAATITDGSRILAASLDSAHFDSVSYCEAGDTQLVVRNTGCDTLTIAAATYDTAYFGLDPSPSFPLRIPPDSSVVWDVRTRLDTVGHVLAIADHLQFLSNSDSPAGTIPLSYSVRYPQQVGFELVPMAAALPADSSVYYDLYSRNAIASLGATELRFTMSHAPDLLTYLYPTGPNTVSESSYSTAGSVTHDFTVEGSPIVQDKNGSIARLWFKTAVARSSATRVGIDSLTIDPADPDFIRCTAYALPVSDTSFTLTNACGDSLLRAYLQGGPLVLRINSNTNGAIAEIRSRESVQGRLRVVNILGASMFETDLSLLPGDQEYPLPASLPEGPLFVQLFTGSGDLAHAAFINIKR